MQRRETHIEVATPFSLKATVLSHGWHECAPMSWSEGGRCLQWIDRIDGRASRVFVTEQRRQTRKITLRVTIEGEGVSDASAERIRADLRLMLGLDRDLSDFYRLCRTHPTLSVIPHIGAGRLVRSASMTENLIKTLCSTNVTWTQAVKMINRIAQLGPPVRHFVHLNAWPTPREILRAGSTYLKEVCRVGYRAENILMLCREVCAGRTDPDLLTVRAGDPATSTDELLFSLRSIRGIGPSSAHFLLGFLGRHDRLSIDSATISHVARTHTNGRKPTVRKVERVYERYGRWKNLVCWYENWLAWETARCIVREADKRPVSPAGRTSDTAGTKRALRRRATRPVARDA